MSTTPTVSTTLVSVSDTKETENGRLYFTASFKRGAFGKPSTRTFWGTRDDSGNVSWERVSPEEVRPLIGHDMASEVEVVAVDIEPEEFTVTSTGEIRTIESKTLVRFSDETLEQVCRKYGSRLREPKAAPAQTEASPVVGMPGHYVVSSNGHKATAA